MLLTTNSRILVGWVAAVARLGATLPLGQLRTPHLLAVADLWRRGAAVVSVINRPRPRALLSGLRRVGVRDLDVVAVRSPLRSAGPAMAPVLERHPARVILTPATATRGSSVTVGELRVDVVSVRPRLDVRVRAVEGE